MLCSKCSWRTSLLQDSTQTNFPLTSCAILCILYWKSSCFALYQNPVCLENTVKIQIRHRKFYSKWGWLYQPFFQSNFLFWEEKRPPRRWCILKMRLLWVKIIGVKKIAGLNTTVWKRWCALRYSDDLMSLLHRVMAAHLQFRKT